MCIRTCILYGFLVAAIVSFHACNRSTLGQKDLSPQANKTGSAAATVAPMLSQSDVPADISAPLQDLIGSTLSNDPMKRLEAVASLGELREQGAPAIPFLLQLLNDDTIAAATEGPHKGIHTCVSAAAADALVAIGRASVDPCLESLRRQRGTAGECKLVRILGRIRDPRSLSMLRQAIMSSNPRVREAGLQAIEDWQEPLFVPSVLRCLSDPVADVRIAAARVSYELHDQRLVLPLIRSLNDVSAEVRWSSANALGWQRDPRAIPYLLGILHGPENDRQLKEFCGRALGMIGDHQVRVGLLTILNDNHIDSSGRAGAATGLAVAGEKESIAPLESIANDHHAPSFLREKAIGAISELDGVHELQFLSSIAVNEHEDSSVRVTAAKQVIRGTGGAIDNSTIIDAFAGTIDEREEEERGTLDALISVVKNGRNATTRDHARLLIKRKWPGMSLEASNGGRQ